MTVSSSFFNSADTEIKNFVLLFLWKWSFTLSTPWGSNSFSHKYPHKCKSKFMPQQLRNIMAHKILCSAYRLTCLLFLRRAGHFQIMHSYEWSILASNHQGIIKDQFSLSPNKERDWVLMAIFSVCTHQRNSGLRLKAGLTGGALCKMILGYVHHQVCIGVLSFLPH